MMFCFITYVKFFTMCDCRLLDYHYKNIIMNMRANIYTIFYDALQDMHLFASVNNKHCAGLFFGYGKYDCIYEE